MGEVPEDLVVLQRFILKGLIFGLVSNYLSENINFDENIINFLAVKSNTFLIYEL